MAGSDRLPGDRNAATALQILAMPESGGDPGEIARLVDENRDPDLFWSICEWGTAAPAAARLQAMLEMLLHKDIRLHPHAQGETLDQLAYHAPALIVETYLDRMERMLAADPGHAADCWTDLVDPLGERMADAGRSDLAARVRDIDRTVENILAEEEG